MNFEIVIPVYNEEASLKFQIEHLLSFISEFQQNHAILITIADNGSTDSTIKLAELLVKSSSSLRLIRVPSKGVGLALKAAWDTSNADVVGYMDLDFSTPLKHLKDVFHLFQTQPIRIISGSRYLQGSTISGRKIVRSIASRGLNLFLKFILDVRFSDAMVGFKFMRRDLYHQLRIKGLNNDGWFFNAEILIKSEWYGERVYDIPVQWVDDVNSKVRITPLVWYYIREIIKLRIGKSRLVGKR